MGSHKSEAQFDIVYERTCNGYMDNRVSNETQPQRKLHMNDLYLSHLIRHNIYNIHPAKVYGIQDAP